MGLSPVLMKPQVGHRDSSSLEESSSFSEKSSAVLRVVHG